MSSQIPPAALLGIGTALPAYPVSQQQALAAVHPPLEPGSRREQLARRLFRNAKISERRFCIPDFSGSGGVLFDSTSNPSTSKRMEVYEREAPRLAAAACEQALKTSGVSRHEISHLIVVSCTGVFVPGPDVEIASLLSLRPDVERTLVGFMGCSGAFHGLRVGRRAAVESPDARALVVCVELCSLHRRASDDADGLVATSLFGDGAGAMVLGRVSGSRDHLLEFGTARTHLDSASRDALTWRIREDGFEVHLSRELPAIVERGVGGFVEPLLAGTESGAPLSWVVHPGGAAVLRAIERGLGLEWSDLEVSYDILNRLGNTSSAAILYVLEESLARLTVGAEGVMLGFGPGLTFEAVGFRRGAAQVR